MEKASFTARRAWGTIEKLKPSSVSFKVFRLFMNDDGTFPNNSECPLLLYKSAFSGSESEGEQAITQGGGWTSPWAWGIFTFHHYHSAAWELLLCTRGQALVQLGGEKGPTVEISKGDLILIPPGFAHKQLETRGGFTLLGSYPTDGWLGEVDTLRGPPTDQERKRIAACPMPTRDPVFGLEISELVGGV